jgi:hypothetical protein
MELYEASCCIFIFEGHLGVCIHDFEIVNGDEGLVGVFGFAILFHLQLWDQLISRCSSSILIVQALILLR